MKKKLLSLDLKTHVKIHTFTLLIGGVLIVIGCRISQFGSLHPVAWIGLLIIAASLLWRILFIKCPHCGNGLYGVRSIPQYCPDCGEKL